MESRKTTKKLNINKSTGKSGKKPTSGKGKRRKFKNTRLFKLLRLLLLLIIIIIVCNVIMDITHKSPENITLVIGEEKIVLQNNVISDEYNNFYLSLDDIAKLFDENIYYNNDTVITTYDKHIAVLEMDKTTMSVDDTVYKIEGTMHEENGIVYLPFSDMGEYVYDFEYSYNKEDKVLIVDSLSEAKSQAIVLKNTKLKENTGFGAKTIEKVKKAEYVLVLETKDDYTKVRTNAGNVGYIKTKKLSEVEKVRDAMEKDVIEKINILDDYSIVSTSYDILTDNLEENSIVMPNLFTIEENDEEANAQTVIDLTSNKFSSYKEWANSSKVSICPTVTLDASINKICSNYTSRACIINTLKNSLTGNVYTADQEIRAVCIDFENIDDTEAFYRFLIEMMPKFRADGIKVFVKFQSTLNKERLNSIVDYVID